MVTIVTYSHKRPDFIYLQYDSIKKHVKSKYEYIVFNNSIDNIETYNQIHDICSELGVKCVDIQLTEDLKFINGESNFNNNKYTNPNLACSYPLIWSFKNYFNADYDIISVIDSDMFFINDIDIENEINNKDMIYIPQYRDYGRVHYPWNAFICLNIKRNKNLLNLNWHPGSVNGVACDVGGQAHYDLINNNFETRIIEEYSIRDIKYDLNSNYIEYIQNGNINYRLVTDKNFNLINFNQIGGDKIFNNKSFIHENDFQDHSSYILRRTKSMVDILYKYNMNLPDPKHIGFIGFIESDEYFILHYKSGSNYLNFTTDNYNYLKTEEVKKILK